VPEQHGENGPRILADAGGVIAMAANQDLAGAAWKLAEPARDLDANIVRLRPGGSIGRHAGPDLDVLLLILDGTGRLNTAAGPVELRQGALLWLPRRSEREFTAGPGGLAYLTVHRRRQSLVVGPPPGPPGHSSLFNED
jgi:quercetin dioxygenase-like cupin family protein